LAFLLDLVLNLSHQSRRFLHSFKRLFMHTLYVKLMILLLCITFSVILMQAGSLFLLDYNPSSQNAILAVNNQHKFWKYQLDISHDKSYVDFGAVMQVLGHHHLDSISPELAWLEKQSDPKLSAPFKKLRLAQVRFDEARIQNARFDQQRSATVAVIEAYDALGLALARDLELKQSVISLLQLLGLLLVLCSLGGIALGARRLLVDRFDALTNFIPNEFIKRTELSDDDEFAELERALYEMSASIEGFKAETIWFNQTSSERLRRMIRLQEFLFRFVNSVNNTMLSDTALRKGLFSLEKALNVNNAALIFSEDDMNAERVLFSHHKPLKLSEEIVSDLQTSSFVRFYGKSLENVKSQILAVGFTSPSGALGVLLLEANEDHLFDETETQLLELTAQLLTMIMGFQGREQEGRRVALLEERSALARELHDSLAQSLSYMKIQIARLQSSSASSMAVEARDGIINQLREGLDNAYRELRELLATFRVHMDVRGLGFAIQSAIDEFTQRGNLSIVLDNRLVNARLTVNEEFHILHVIREALSNIVRHSGATSTTVTLEYQSSGTILVTIDDDGIGYTPQAMDQEQSGNGDVQDTPGHYGQKIMKERAYSLGGDITVLRRRKGGTRVRLVFTPKLPQ
jgi:two-component system, NarL family, nitrate/nitrite sensor histidine kinase NarX